MHIFYSSNWSKFAFNIFESLIEIVAEYEKLPEEYHMEVLTGVAKIVPQESMSI